MGIQGTRLGRGANRTLIIAATAAGAMLCAPAYAADMAGTANAAVVRPNTLIKTDDLDFGTLISGATGGTVTINPVTNARTTSGGVTPVGSAAQRATFQGTWRWRSWRSSSPLCPMSGSGRWCHIPRC